MEVSKRLHERAAMESAMEAPRRRHGVCMEVPWRCVIEVA